MYEFRGNTLAPHQMNTSFTRTPRKMNVFYSVPNFVTYFAVYNVPWIFEHLGFLNMNTSFQSILNRIPHLGREFESYLFFTSIGLLGLS